MKKTSPWLIGGVVLAMGAGLAGVLLGLVLPGTWTPPEGGASPGVTPLQTLRKRMESQQEKGKETPLSESKKLSDKNLHRVFVSRPLIFLPKDSEPVQPINDQQITDDGIQIGWKMKYQFDPEDPSVAEEDTDRDGFTNKEEFEKGTNPRDPSSSPAKWVKVKILAVETNAISLGFSGKSGDRYTLRLLLAGKKKDVDVVVGDQLWLAATVKGLEVLRSESDWKKLKDGGGCPHAIPVKVKGYHESKGKRMDDKTKTENDYDDSYLELERLDGLGGTSKILIDERGKSRGVVFSVGDIRLLSLVPGEGEMGPYRVGQSFSYAGKEFVVRNANPKQVSLLMRPEGEEIDILPKTP